MSIFSSLRRQNGFSMIELMIVFSLLAVVTGIGFFSFINYSRIQEVDQGAKDIASFYGRARANASSFVKPSICGSGALRGYRVDYCPNATCQGGDTYEMRVVCGGQEHVVDTLSLTDNIVHDEASDCTSIIYRLPQAVAEGTLPCSQIIGRSGATETVTVDRQGHVVFGEDGQTAAEIIPTPTPTDAPTTLRGGSSDPADNTSEPTSSSVTVAVNNGLDDGWWTTTNNTFSSSDAHVYVGGWLDSTYGAVHSFYRFVNIPIPSGSQITSAHLILTANQTLSSQTVNSRIRAINEDNAVAPISLRTAHNALRTSTFVDWSNIPSFTSGQQYNSPDITGVVQEVVNRPGWNSGNALVIYTEDNFSTARSGTVRRIHSFEGSAAGAAKIFIEYIGS